jgi:hypothetical protein
LSESFIKWIIGGSGLALVSAIAYLHKLYINQSKDIIDISSRLGKVEGRQKGINELADRVLDTVRIAVTPKK